MATIEDYNFIKSYITEKTILTFFGFYPDKNENPLSWKYLRRTLSFISITLFMTHMFLSLLTLTYEKLFKSSRIWIEEFGFYAKLIIFLYYNKTVLGIENSLKDKKFYGFNLKYLTTIKNDIDYTTKFCNRYLFLSFCYLSVLVGYPFAMHLIKGENVLATDGYCPCDVQRDFCFNLTILFQFVNFSISIMSNCSIDFFFCILIAVSCSLFDILKNNLRNINFNDTETSQVQLKDNVVFHNEILSLLKEIERVFSWILFFHVLASIGSICLGIFTLIMNRSMSALVEMIQFFAVVFLQIGFPCWAGNNILFKHEEVQESLYMSNWYEADLKVRKTIKIIMERTKRPVSISGAGFFTVSLATMTTILKSSYSFLNVMLRLYN